MYNKELASFHIKRHESFIDYLSNDELSGSFLFVGQDSIGKKDFACAISEVILNNTDKIAKGIHPDFFLLNVEGEQIVVDDISQIEAWVFNRPFEANKKIIVIPSAEKMNFVAQNKLLKILEEPPDYLFFFLLTPNSSLLLPTVESRCIKLALDRLPDNIIAQSLDSKFIDKDKLNIALFLLNGSYDNENFYTEDKITDFIDFTKIVILKEAVYIDKLVDYLDKFFKTKSNNYKTINTIIRLLSFVLRIKHSSSNDNTLLNKIISDKVSSYNIGELIMEIEDINVSLNKTNMNVRVSLEELLLDFILRDN
jgi:DNA polymerase-3 subunit delta'